MGEILKMSFTTLHFFLFLAMGVLIYYLLPKKLQWVWLLVLSYLYYFTFSIKTSVFLIFTTVVTYTGGILLTRMNESSKAYLAANKETLDRAAKKAYKEKVKKNKRRVVVAMLLLCFGLLGVVKYLNFVIENIDALVLAVGHGQYFEPVNIILPLGISFYTFQSISYIIDVYQGKYSAEKNIFKYALFVSFFPQLLQGPIGRFDRLAHQLYEGRSFSLKAAEFGLQRILWGCFKKMVLADRVAGFVTTVFGNYTEYGGWYNLVAVLLYCVQLYADFSGGIDIVIGTAEIFGIRMDENFRQPFFSKSIGEFWRRWHITLGAWMKDYIFYPFSLSKQMNSFGKWCKKHIGGHAGKAMPICLANLLIFFVVGIWHGAAWKYIAYGMYNGIIIAVSSLLEPLYAKGFEKTKIHKESKAWTVVQIIRTFILVNIGWYFDMAVSFSAALVMMKETFTKMSMSQFTGTAFLELGMGRRDFLIVLAGCIIIFIVSLLKERGVAVREAIAAKPLIVRWAVWYAFIVIIFIFAYTGDGSAFIYANF